jgi:hypothetical protein
MDGIRLLSRRTSALSAVAAAVAAAVVGVALAAPAVAGAQVPTAQAQPLAGQHVREDPPDVRGLSVDDARKALQAWNRSVVIQVVPERLPAGVNESTVVVASSTLLNPPSSPSITVQRTVMRLSLGSRVPDLIGMTSAAAAQALVTRGLRLAPPSPRPEPTWAVSAQQVPPGTIVEFGATVAATFAAPETRPPTLVLVGGAGLVLLLLGLATALAIRASRRRARRRRDRLAAAVRLETHPGQVVGPELTEHAGTVSVRLEPHHDRGTLRMEEIHR